MFKKLSVRLSLAIIIVMVLVLGLFTAYLVRDRSRQLQQSIMDKGISAAQTGATVMGKMFDTIIDNDFFTVAEVFDSTLVPIELPEKIVRGYVDISDEQRRAIQKFHYATGLDSYLDNAISEIQDQFLEDPQVSYAVLIDVHGYLPSHNSVYSQKLIGKYEHDLNYNRTKRIFQDDVAMQAARNQDKACLRQIYHRDTGEVMWDFSSPVLVKGKHWGVFRVGFSLEDTRESIAALQWKIILLMGVLLIVLILVVSRITNVMMRPLGQLNTGVQQVARGDLSSQQKVTSNDEVGDLARAFNTMVCDLKKYIKDLTETTAAKEKIESELKIAHDIQMGILPKIFPAFPDRKEIDIHAVITPAREVGGDFFDFFFIDDHHLCFTIGDVSGKGVPASLFMAVTITMLRAKTGPGMMPDQILNRTNIDLSADNENCMFVTIFCGILDIRTGELAYSNGGHNIPYLLHRNGMVDPLENTATMALGVNPDFQYQTKKVQLRVNDGIFLYTDGVTEALSEEKEMFSEERLEKMLESACRFSAEEINRQIEENLRQFIADEPQFDDITLITLKYFGVKNGAGSRNNHE